MNFNMFFPLLRRSFSDWNDDNAPRLAARSPSTPFFPSRRSSSWLSLSYLVFDRSTAQAHLLSQVQALVSPDGRNAVQPMLASGQKASSGLFATVIGSLTIIFGASGVFGELRSALNAIWEAEPKTKSGIWGMVRERFFSFGMVISVGFVLIVSLLASTAYAAMSKFFGGFLPLPSFVLGIFTSLSHSLVSPCCSLSF
jgi:membrane protein